MIFLIFFYPRLFYVCETLKGARNYFTYENII